MKITADVQKHGSLFDGRAEAELTEGIRRAREEAARKAQQEVTTAFEGRIKHNTGRFLSSITTTDETRTYSSESGGKAYTMTVVADRSTDSLVTTTQAAYGPWLEGVGSRNDTTRFKGYHGFRLAAQRVQQRMSGIVEKALEPYVRRINV